MSIHYISMLMYDIQMTTKEDVRKYQRFHKEIEKMGYYKLQGSIYIKKMNTKERIETYERTIYHFSPETAHIRMLTLTEKQFNTMSVIRGEESLHEKIVKEKDRILEF